MHPSRLPEVKPSTSSHSTLRAEILVLDKQNFSEQCCCCSISSTSIVRINHASHRSSNRKACGLGFVCLALQEEGSLPIQLGHKGEEQNQVADCELPDSNFLRNERRVDCNLWLALCAKERLKGFISKASLQERYRSLRSENVLDKPAAQDYELIQI